MAKQRKYGWQVGLFTSPLSETPTWSLLACMESKSVSLTRDSIEINTDCEQGNAITLPGNVSWTISGTGHYITDPEIAQVSANDLLGYANANPAEVRLWKLDDGEGYVRIGEGYISDYSEDMDASGFVTFSLTISNSGSLSDVELS